MLWKYCTQYASKFGKLNHSHRTGKGLFSFQCQRSQSQRIFKLPHNHMHFKASKVMLKILQARLQRYMNQELPDVQDGFRESRGTRDQIANTCWIIEKQGNSRKTSTSVSMTTLKPLTVWITTNCANFLKEMNIRQPYLPPENLYVAQEATIITNAQWVKNLPTMLET